MTRSIRLWLGFYLMLAAGTLAAADEKATQLRLTLPPVCYAVPGVPMSIYYDNIVLTEKPEDYLFTVNCDLGKSEARRWTVTPTPADVGEHPLVVSVATRDGKTLQQAQTVLHVSRADAGAGQSIRLLIIGDSLTAATVYSNQIARQLSLPGNPSWTMLGTNRPASGAKGVVHEGYGGWTWVRFLSHYEPNPDRTKRKFSSPFVFPGKNGKPAIDLPQYFQTSCHGQRPDFITIMLGINDCFGAKPDDPVAIDRTIGAMFTHADQLVAAFRSAAPQAQLGICLTTPPNSRESGFEANYKGKYHRWGWKRIQHRLVECQLKHFGKREAEQIFIVPTELNLDPVDGYPVNNGVHPNAVGYQQIGDSIYAWLKARIQATQR